MWKYSIVYPQLPNLAVQNSDPGPHPQRRAHAEKLIGHIQWAELNYHNAYCQAGAAVKT